MCTSANPSLVRKALTTVNPHVNIVYLAAHRQVREREGPSLLPSLLRVSSIVEFLFVSNSQVFLAEVMFLLFMAAFVAFVLCGDRGGISRAELALFGWRQTAPTGIEDAEGRCVGTSHHCVPRRIHTDEAGVAEKRTDRAPFFPIAAYDLPIHTSDIHVVPVNGT